MSGCVGVPSLFVPMQSGAMPSSSSIVSTTRARRRSPACLVARLTPCDGDRTSLADGLEEVAVVARTHRVWRLQQLGRVRGDEREEVHHDDPAVTAVHREPFALTDGRVVRAVSLAVARVTLAAGHGGVEQDEDERLVVGPAPIPTELVAVGALPRLGGVEDGPAPGVVGPTVAQLRQVLGMQPVAAVGRVEALAAAREPHAGRTGKADAYDVTPDAEGAAPKATAVRGDDAYGHDLLERHEGAHAMAFRASGEGQGGAAAVADVGEDGAEGALAGAGTGRLRGIAAWRGPRCDGRHGPAVRPGGQLRQREALSPAFGVFTTRAQNGMSSSTPPPPL